MTTEKPVYDLVYDVGAHTGEDSDFYLKLGYRVVAIEANPILVKKLQTRFDNEIKLRRYILLPNAIGESNEEITFYVNKKESEWSTTDPKMALRNKLMGADSEEIKVNCIRLDDIVREYGCPQYIKIDIEGADMLCLNAIKNLNTPPTYVSIESNKTSWLDLLNEFATFERLGYKKFKVVNQRKHKNGIFKTIAGEALNYVFGKGFSGPFGENLEGQWLTKNQAIIRYIPIFLIYKTIGNNTFLSNSNGRLPFLWRLSNHLSWYDTHAMKS